ncbi:hypothetical protein SBRY_20418 [Actinacidiphila bryophytorum]|uniref:Uncharacterized protein n=1 Tax=Actinacidiphila bryophytorum TaxID=1436133 RepID=A0A9W4GY61_9ACTN|nr:hypothetical protein SBRY_20418 [Actinacidiphila bryophytorum]
MYGGGSVYIRARSPYTRAVWGVGHEATWGERSGIWAAGDQGRRDGVAAGLRAEQCGRRDAAGPRAQPCRRRRRLVPDGSAAGRAADRRPHGAAEGPGRAAAARRRRDHRRRRTHGRLGRDRRGPRGQGERPGLPPGGSGRAARLRPGALPRQCAGRGPPQDRALRHPAGALPRCPRRLQGGHRRRGPPLRRRHPGDRRRRPDPHGIANRGRFGRSSVLLSRFDPAISVTGVTYSAHTKRPFIHGLCMKGRPLVIPSIGRGSHTKQLSEFPPPYCTGDRRPPRPLRMRSVDGVFDPQNRHL